MLKYLNCVYLLFVICCCVQWNMCLKPKTFIDMLERIESFETYDVDCDFCDYVELENVIPVKTNDLVVIQLNVRGWYSKIDKLKTLLDECTTNKKADIILLYETWQSKTSPIPRLDGYLYIYKHCQHKLGGVGIFVSDKLKHKERTDLYIVDCSFEYCLIEVKLKHNNVLLCSGYRAPNTNPTNFLIDYENLLKMVNAENNKIIVGIDHNLDLLKHMTHTPSKKIVELFENFDQIPCITRPTHITKSSATLINNVFVPTTMSLMFNCYLLIDDMSDHLPAIIVLGIVCKVKKGNRN